MNTMHKITKSDFLMYLDTPMHLWAQTHDALEISLSPLAVLMMNQGYAVEEFAKVYLEQEIVQSEARAILEWQRSFTTDLVSLRTDALILHQLEDTYDLYEVKSGTSVSKDHLYDIAFQYLVLKAQIPLSRVFILHLNREYIREGDLDIQQLFHAEEVTEKVQELLPEIEGQVALAAATANTDAPRGIKTCLKPHTCPCPSLCHPDLPEHSIFEISGLRDDKKQQLLERDVMLIRDIPAEFKMPKKQRQAVDVFLSNKPVVDQSNIQQQVDAFAYPYHFLDYESCISAIPLYDGYHPQQQIVFQYSLHTMRDRGGELVHKEFIDLEDHDPAAQLLEQLREDIGDLGTVFVWNKGFEVTQNKEMALIHPEYADFIENLNRHIFDLADFIKEGWYLHPEFKGKWSLKDVLPVMVPELTYQQLAISKGDMTSVAWWEATQKPTLDFDMDVVREDLSAYCEMDTLAMVKILEKLNNLAGA